MTSVGPVQLEVKELKIQVRKLTGLNKEIKCYSAQAVLIANTKIRQV